MSTRTFDTVTLGLGGEATEIVMFVFMDFVGEPVFIHSSFGWLTWGGEDWIGAGLFGSVSSVPEVMGVAPARVKLSFSPAAASILNEALNENTWGRLCELYLGTVSNGALTRDPELVLRGLMGPPEVVLGRRGSISVQVEDVRSLLNRINGMRATLQDHQADTVSSDTFYKSLPAMMDHKFIFNGQIRPSNVIPTTPSEPPQHWYPGYNPLMP